MKIHRISMAMPVNIEIVSDKDEIIIQKIILRIKRAKKVQGQYQRRHNPQCYSNTAIWLSLIQTLKRTT